MEPYDPAYFEQTHRNWFAHPQLDLFTKIAELIEREPLPRSVIDVGCGNGNLLRFLATRWGTTVALTGVDLMANEPSPGIEFIQGDIHSVDIHRQFSVVVSLATIEHLADAHAFACRLTSLTRLGGIAIVMTLNDNSLLYAAARLLRASVRRWHSTGSIAAITSTISHALRWLACSKARACGRKPRSCTTRRSRRSTFRHRRLPQRWCFAAASACCSPLAHSRSGPICRRSFAAGMKRTPPPRMIEPGPLLAPAKPASII